MGKCNFYNKCRSSDNFMATGLEVFRVIITDKFPFLISIICQFSFTFASKIDKRVFCGSSTGLQVKRWITIHRI